MAFTLRLDPALDAALEQAAERDGTSKHELILRLAREYTGRRRDQLDSSIDRVLRRDKDLLARLGDV